MTCFLISFPSAAMVLSDFELQAAAHDSHAVIAEMKAAGVYRFGGGIDEGVAPVQVDSGGHESAETYPQSRELDGGMTVIEVETREEAVGWAQRLAAACRTTQELRQFMSDPDM